MYSGEKLSKWKSTGGFDTGNDQVDTQRIPRNKFAPIQAKLQTFPQQQRSRFHFSKWIGSKFAQNFRDQRVFQFRSKVGQTLILVRKNLGRFDVSSQLKQ